MFYTYMETVGISLTLEDLAAVLLISLNDESKNSLYHKKRIYKRDVAIEHALHGKYSKRIPIIELALGIYFNHGGDSDHKVRYFEHLANNSPYFITEDICKIFINKNPLHLQSLIYWKMGDFVTKDLCRIAVSSMPLAIENVCRLMPHLLTKELCTYAIKKNPYVRKYIKEYAPQFL